MWRGMAVAMRQIEDAVGNPPGGAVRRDVANPDAELRSGFVGSDLDGDLRRAEDFHPLGQRIAVEDERKAVVVALIDRSLAQDASAHPFPDRQARPARRADRFCLAGLWRVAKAVVVEMERARLNARRRPMRLAHEAAGDGIAIAWRRPFLDE